MTVQTPTTGSTTTPAPKKKGLGVGTAIGPLSTVVALMLLAFLTPAIHSGAHDLPLAVGGPAPAVAKIQGALDTKAPGTFDVTTYGSADEAAQAVKDRKAVGAISVVPTGATITTASGAGAPYTPILKGIGAGLEAQGQKVTYTDVAPMTADDPAGVGITAVGLPLIFGGLATAVIMTLLVKGSTTRRVLGALGVAACGGLVAALILGPWFGSFDGSFLGIWAAIATGMAAISLTVLGLESLLGHAGLGLGALLMLFISNPLSGMAAGPAWLPAPWGTIGQLMPLGAASSLMRSVAYFGGHGLGMAPWVLLVWALVGLAMAVLGARRHAAGHRSPATPVEPAEVGPANV